MLSRAEKFELVKRLLEEGKTYKEIAKLAHVSCTQIGLIRRELEGESENSEPNIRIKAYEKFKNGDSPIDVAISLHRNNEETLRYWKEYLQLTGHHKLVKVRDELREDFEPFFQYIMRLKGEGFR